MEMGQDQRLMMRRKTLKIRMMKKMGRTMKMVKMGRVRRRKRKTTNKKSSRTKMIKKRMQKSDIINQIAKIKGQDQDRVLIIIIS
jgi:hypothetical protein